MIGAENVEWVQIKDPKSKKTVFINVTNGECRNNLPPNTLFKPFEENQWWQLHDIVSSCYYYYNTSSHQTIWKRPTNVEVVPLYKVQQFSHETSNDWRAFLNEKLENSRRTTYYKAPTSRWNLLSRSRKYSFGSNNNLESVEPDRAPGESRSSNRPTNSASSDEGLDFASQDFVGNVGHSTLRVVRTNETPVEFCFSKSKASRGNMSRSYDQMNNNEWATNREEASRLGRRGVQNSHERYELPASQKPPPNFPRTNPHMTMQRSSSSFRSNKDGLLPKDDRLAMQNARSMADRLHDHSATLRRKHFVEMDHTFSKVLFPSSFNFRGNQSKGDPVQLLSFKSGTIQTELKPSQASAAVSSPHAKPPHPTSSQSSLMISSVMSTSMKSCDTADEFVNIDQSSFRSAVTRGNDECDGNSVFSSSSTPPLIAAPTAPTWTHKVSASKEGNARNALLSRKPQREKSSENSKKTTSNRDQRPHGLCYSESDAQWGDDVSRFHFVSSNGPHITPFAQFAMKELSLTSFNDHRKRFLGKLVPVGCLLNWTKDGIRKPILRTSNRIVNREAPDVLKRIQLYMDDRNLKRSHSSTSLMRINSAKSSDGENVSSLVDQSVLAVVVRGWTLPEMRDEIFMQLCKQTNANPRVESTYKGWELMCICLSFFPPARMTSCIKQRLNEATSVSAYCNHPKLQCCLKQLPRRLENALATGAKRGVCKPTAQEFEVSRDSIYSPPLFGSLLGEVMEIQKEKFPQRRLPWILTTLSEAVLRLNGMNMEGIFRIPGDIDEVNRLKAELCEKWAFPAEPLKFDASVPASLLKLWLRQLHEPLIPYGVYADCLEAAGDPQVAVDIVSSRLPSFNRLVLAYVVRFLQVFAAPPVSSKTKMDANNLAMVMAPNLLRSHITDPALLLDQAKKEMSFVRLLILTWDTSFMENVV